MTNRKELERQRGDKGEVVEKHWHARIGMNQIIKPTLPRIRLASCMSLCINVTRFA